MGQTASAFGAQPFKVRECSKIQKAMYLAPGAESLACCNDGLLLPQKPTPSDGFRIVRVVCISDTHNEHEGLALPAGDLLLHTGDCLTETGQRGYVVRKRGVIQTVKPEGIAIFEHFAAWFGSQNFNFKVLIAGNHDLVLQGLGKVRVQEILDAHTTIGTCVYLEHDEVCVGGVRIFGSPFACWGGKNDAFLSVDCDYSEMPVGVNIMMTHAPAILPSEGGGQDEDFQVTSALHRTGASLHVSGHCHWAHGLYHSKGSGASSVPCVVASVCSGNMFGGPWHNSQPERLASAQGVRGDPLDKKFGGYNLDQPPIVCDVALPAAKMKDTVTRTAFATSCMSLAVPLEDEEETQTKPAMLFFGPPNDKDFVRNALPRAREVFDVEFVDTTVDGLQAVENRRFVACIAKLGTEGNLSYPVITALRKSQGAEPFVAIHSLTAAANPQMREQLMRELNINMFVTAANEDELFHALQQHVVSSPG